MWILPQLFFCSWLASVLCFLFGLPLSLFLPCLSHLREDFSLCLACDLGGCSYVEPLQILPNQSVNVSVLVGFCVQPILQLAVHGYPDALLGSSVSSLAVLVFSCWFRHVSLFLVPAGWAGVFFLSVFLLFISFSANPSSSSSFAQRIVLVCQSFAVIIEATAQFFSELLHNEMTSVLL